MENEPMTPMTPERIEAARRMLMELEVNDATAAIDIEEEASRSKKSVAAARTEERAKWAAERGRLVERLDRLTEGVGDIKQRMMQMERQRANARQYATILDSLLRPGTPVNRDELLHTLNCLRDTLASVPEAL